ncbi:ATP-dependent DNA helicase Hel308 [Candidatus Gugararchaeum adminiculabundum]|nr:ATP-dependent DNA helicase Hel308 [Candidatus Gugararchaeum adminiculabundum]
MYKLDETRFTPRAYQLAIAESAIRESTLVVLPTGMGKTLIAMLVMQHFLATANNKGKVLFLAPTKPLCEQHYKTIKESMNIPDADENGIAGIALISGAVSPPKRKELYNSRIVVATPQTIKNDFENLRVASGFDYSLCVIDEAHRAVGNYAYTFVAKMCGDKGVQILALTASPGGNRQKIEETLEALFIKRVEARSETDADVQQYMQQVDMKWIEVELSDQLKRCKLTLEQMLNEHLEVLAKFGFPLGKRPSKMRLFDLRDKILQAENKSTRMLALSQYSTIFNLLHSLELLETQGVSTFLNYLERARQKQSEKEKPTKGVERFLNDLRMKKLEEELKGAVEHPKLLKLVELVRERPGKKLIVFVQYRDQIAKIVETLKQNGFRAERFVGKKDGVTQKEQQATVQLFREGGFDILVASSIGEEGLDIPSVDSVIFFEPVPSEIRSIQRRGRAGRAKSGEVVILITKGTRDEAYYWASRTREKRMRKIVGNMQTGASGTGSTAGAKQLKARSREKSLRQADLKEFSGD